MQKENFTIEFKKSKTHKYGIVVRSVKNFAGKEKIVWIGIETKEGEIYKINSSFGGNELTKTKSNNYQYFNVYDQGKMWMSRKELELIELNKQYFFYSPVTKRN